MSETERLRKMANRWICKWRDEVHSPTATDLLTDLLKKVYAQGRKSGIEDMS